MTGRRQDAVWQYFIKIKNDKKPLRAKCKHCGKEMCSLVARMKMHIFKCKHLNKVGSVDNPPEVVDIEHNESTKENNPPTHERIDKDDNIEINTINENNESSDSSHISGKLNFQNKRSKMVDLSETVPQTQSPLCSTSSTLFSMTSSNSEMSSTNLNSFVIRTTNVERKNIDLQIAKFVYSTNSSFRLVEHKEFKNMISLLRPGYKPPNRHTIANELLDNVFTSVRQSMEKDLKGKIVCMAMDGWSNLHVEPLICISITDVLEGNIHLIDTIDTAENRHTADYLLKLAVTAIKRCQRFDCSIRSFVTDNASNMVKMRSQLAQCEEIFMPDIITYGCSAHILNLLAKDINVPELKDNVKTIIKYFKYSHYPASKYKQEGGTSLILPLDTRWNTLCNCFESYIKNWHILAKICTENRAAIDIKISTQVQNLDLKSNIQNIVLKLRKIAVALDKIQAETCTIGEVTQIWLNLSEDIKEETFTQQEIQCFQNRFNMAITPPHYLANLLDHRFRGQKLSQDQLEEALEYAATYHAEAMPFIINYQSKCSPFREFLFSPQNIENVSPLSWWRALQNSINNAMFDLSMQLHTAVASSAGIERLFSTFGIIHNKLRNKLGTEKAAKLVTIMRAYNSNNSLLEEI
ncbi:PREDICTED: uncharacterized protein LOC105557715 [Vollenhovia emeryi]|uniref:uncharacterized protein LOC105557715 n=1 Tax=Vollenhovia emeryi TaxID=411798 RepID=UPI0005F48196|nr:PREDICTED: uncharacterized protein LOC105557715 [Vollenhovia emeryi]XP_011860420.1 PREDICTED: uncharacterized protein LOC105557715 [Vollenhovia emeryi]